MRRVKAVILAAGHGKRLRPLTDRMPKCLAPVAGQPLLDYWLNLLGDAGIRHILINSHTFPEQVRDYIASRRRGGCLDIVDSFEPELLGSAGTLAANAGYADDADLIVTVYADNLSDVDLAAMLAYHQSHTEPVTMLLFRATDPRSCGIAELDGAGTVISFVEKPQAPRSDLANAGVYVVDAAAFREIAAMKAFDIGFDVLPRFVGRMKGWAWSGYHRDVGTPEAYEQAQRDAVNLLAARGVDENGRQPAVFLDRDGTLIEQVEYLSDPRNVKVIPGVAESIRLLRASGFRCIVVSNQSAVGRGLMSESQLEAVNAEMCRQLALQGAVLDGIYSCCVVPRNGDRTVIDHPDRKPGPGMLKLAADEQRLDLSRSWIVGDLISDVLAGYNAGCRGGVLVASGKSESHSLELKQINAEMANDLAEAVRRIVSDAGVGLRRRGSVFDRMTEARRA